MITKSGQEAPLRQPETGLPQEADGEVMRRGDAAPADEVEALRARLDPLERRIAALADERQAALAERDRLERELRDEQFRADKARTRFHEKQKLARRELNQAASDQAQMRDRMEALYRDLETLQAQNTKLQAQLALAGEQQREAVDPRTRFEIARSYQRQGAVAMAAAAYAELGPELPQFLAQTTAGGQQIHGPDFLIIGAPRAGTTWLKRRLGYHLQLFILAGEHHYFSTTPHLSIESYVARFTARTTRYLRPGGKAAAPPEQRLYGEKSTTYLTMPDSYIDLCAALYPNLRLICVVREPVARAWSHIKHLGHGPQAANLDYLHSLAPWHSLDGIIDHGRYERHLTRWARRFSPDQIQLIDFNRIATEPDAVYRETVAHIGAGPDTKPTLTEPVGMTEAAGPPEAVLEYLKAAYDKEIYDVAELRRAMEAAAAR